MKDIAIAVIGLALLGVVWVAWNQFQGSRMPYPPVACTADAKICPDGSGVGRVGPDCEFAACPGE